jgi:large repetitive protein
MSSLSIIYGSRIHLTTSCAPAPGILRHRAIALVRAAALLLVCGMLSLRSPAVESASSAVRTSAAADSIFRSSFEALGDVTLLTDTQTPADGSTLAADALPTIGIRFIVAVTPVPVARLEMDGVDVTAQAQVGADSIAYTPGQPINEGQHTVRVTLGAAVAQWNFVTATPPMISGETPRDVVVALGTRPFIAADLGDVGAGIDPLATQLKLDGVDVTAASERSETLVSYQPAMPLSAGSHQVELNIADHAGNESQRDWRFVASALPEVSDVSPDSVTLTAGSHVEISARFRSIGDDIDAAKIRLVVNSSNVTAQADVHHDDPRSGTIRYAMPEPSATGPHTVLLEVTTLNGVSVQRVWAFTVAPPDVHLIGFDSPIGGATVESPELRVLVRSASNVSFANLVSINGVEAKLRERLEGAAVYSADLRLVAGPNTLTAHARFADGEEATATQTVIYDAPPKVTILSPADFQAFGPVVLAPGPTPGGSVNLTGTVQRPIAISGTLSKPVTEVTINQQVAQLSADRRSFAFEQYFLHEGTNVISANAIDDSGRVGSAQITVYVDQTAPLLSIEGPAADALTSAARIDVRGVANDAVEAGINAPEPVVEVRNAMNGVTVIAVVADRYYIGRGVPLEVGANLLTITARDAMGNARSRNLQVTRIAAGSRRLTLLSGDSQRKQVNGELDAPLQVAAMDQDGLPIAGLNVHFDVARGSGSISAVAGQDDNPDGVQAARNLVVVTDNAGIARVWFKLGSEAAEAGNMVRAWTPAMAEDVVFTATGLRGVPARVMVNGMSGSQFVQTDSQPLEPLSVVVQDAERNAMKGIPVRFTVIAGEAHFANASAPDGVPSADGRSIIVSADKNGIANARPLTGSFAGSVHVQAQALVDGTPFGSADFQLIVLERRDDPTGFSGVVLDHTGTPLSGVILSIGRTAMSTVSDAEGRFRFDEQVPPGKIDLHVDGTAIHIVRDGQELQYPGLHFETAVVQGQMNQLPHPIYLPPVDLVHARIVGGAEDVRLTIPGIDGFAMIVKANSVTFPDGSRQGPLVVTPVNADRLPMVPPGGFGSFGALAWTIQPSGTRFDPPIEVHIPNTLGMRRGETLSIVQWDHDLATFVPMGRGTVTEDGTLIVSDPGSGVTKAGWGGGVPPVPPNDGCGPPGEPDPENCMDFENLVARCPVVAKFTPKITIAATTPSAQLVTIGDDEYSALSDYSYSFDATLDRGDTQYIQWETTIKNSDRVSGFNNQAPQDAKGPTYAFGVDITRFTSGSVNESPPIHFELSATMCGEKKTVVVKQDVSDIIRQEYTDFRADVAGFNLSVPDRSRLGTSVLYTPNAGLTNPYLVGHGISLDDPSQIARSVATAYNQDLQNTSITRYNQQLAATTDPAQQAQIQALIQQVSQTVYSPTMTSAWRSPRHNVSVGGVTCSNHVKGGAVDLLPSPTTPPNIVRAQNEHWCALRRACGAAGYNECLLELPRATGAGWNGDHACTAQTPAYNAVHAGMEAPCN